MQRGEPLGSAYKNHILGRHAGFLVPLNGLDLLQPIECSFRDSYTLIELRHMLSAHKAIAENQTVEVCRLEARVQTVDAEVEDHYVGYAHVET